jgi:hypothetical protein
MRSLLENFGIALCGLATSILVAITNVAVARITGFDLFTFSVWFVVPAGALFIGYAAASGYYFGSLYFHKKPNAILLIQMVTVAGLTQLLIYWLGYATMVLDDGRRVADLIPFSEYLDVSLTAAHYRMARASSDMGEIGTFGYWLAAIQFVGFLVGGLNIFMLLRSKPVCQSCNLYLRPLATKQKRFADAQSAGGYYNRLFTLPVDGRDFAALIRSEVKVDKVAQGAMQVDTALLGCPACKSQIVEEKFQQYNGQQWKDLSELNRRVNVPRGADLSLVFRG